MKQKKFNRACKKYKEAINILQNSYVSKEDKIKKVYEKYFFTIKRGLKDEK